jgi:transcriptional regulator with XRE-family HTH domain
MKRAKTRPRAARESAPAVLSASAVAAPQVTPPVDRLEAAIGKGVRVFRKAAGFGLVELAKLAGLSSGMLSRIENGTISPSLATLQAVARALQVPVTSLFREFDEVRDTTFVRAGKGLRVSREGPRIGHEYRILGHTTSKRMAMEPYLMSYTNAAEVFSVFQRAGNEFIYILEGKLTYRHGNKLYRMSPGDSLLFDAEVPHGPEELLAVPVKYIAVLCYPRATG